MFCFERWIKSTKDQSRLTLVNEVKTCINAETDLKAALEGIRQSDDVRVQNPAGAGDVSHCADVHASQSSYVWFYISADDSV